VYQSNPTARKCPAAVQAHLNRTGMSGALKKSAATYLVITLHVGVGIAILVACEQLRLPSWINTSVVLLLAFAFLNVGESYLFRLKNELRQFWGIKKIALLFPALAAGIAIALSPAVAGTLLHGVAANEISLNTDISAWSVMLTLVIVGWEELWFRGLFLNYCQRHVPVITLSLTMGFLFMSVHALNPEMHFWQTGPSLFFAGALLTILYFYYRTIWVPVGLHMGNNITGSIVEVKNNTGFWFGEEGYISAAVLAILFFIFWASTKRKTLRAEVATGIPAA
jgi:membrane protease YdiL (CAAX protease family)